MCCNGVLDAAALIYRIDFNDCSQGIVAREQPVQLFEIEFVIARSEVGAGNAIFQRFIPFCDHSPTDFEA
jgi:hypothetical protein